MNVSVSLSKLVAGRQNPRRVKPEREAHRRLVASLRSHGLLEPLIVHVVEDGKHQVIAGNRRLAALREVHRGEDPKVPCITKNVDGDTAAAMSLAENFAREPMHPLDEAEAFAKLASEKCKGVPAIAEEFGVTETYVRQRMKLAGLAAPVKAALRQGTITIGIAEAFAAVPPDRQEDLWAETGGNPRHAQHVRNLIENEWIAATHALFDVTTIDPVSVSHDLFGDNLLVQRSALLPAQTAALNAERERLIDEGWKEAIVAEREQVQDRLYAMDEAEQEYDAPTTAKLAKLREKRARLEAEEPTTEAAEQKMESELEALDTQEREIMEAKPGTYGEATKAKGTAFLILYPDGKVERHYRLPRKEANGNNTGRGGGAVAPDEPEALPTSDDLSPRQLAELYTQEALAVREAVAKDRLVRKRLIVLALSDKVRTDAITIRRDANGTTLVTSNGESFHSALADAQQARRKEIDPFEGESGMNEVEAYGKLVKLTEKELDAIISVLIVDSISGHVHRPTPLVEVLGKELGVSLRTSWTPDAGWLAAYQKAQLAHLTGALKGPVYGSAALGRKKTELVEELAALFSQAAEMPKGFEDKELAGRVNGWLPVREQRGMRFE